MWLIMCRLESPQRQKSPFLIPGLQNKLDWLIDWLIPSSIDIYIYIFQPVGRVRWWNWTVHERTLEGSSHSFPWREGRREREDEGDQNIRQRPRELLVELETGQTEQTPTPRWHRAIKGKNICPAASMRDVLMLWVARWKFNERDAEVTHQWWRTTASKQWSHSLFPTNKFRNESMNVSWVPELGAVGGKILIKGSQNHLGGIKEWLLHRSRCWWEIMSRKKQPSTEHRSFTEGTWDVSRQAGPNAAEGWWEEPLLLRDQRRADWLKGISVIAWIVRFERLNWSICSVQTRTKLVR